MTGIERLKRLREVLACLPEESEVFDLGSWASAETCGTSACAVGHAALDPVLRAEGLYLRAQVFRDDQWRPFKPTTFTGLRRAEKLCHSGFTPCFDGMEDWLAVRQFFDLNSADAGHLFGMHTYDRLDAAGPRPSDVLKRLDAYLARAEG